MARVRADGEAARVSPREIYRSRRRSVPALLVAVPVLGIAWLFPAHGFGLWLRLGAATLVLLLPGQLVARALGRRGSPAVVTWSVALVAGALAITFAVHGSLTLTLGLVLGAGAVAFPFTFRRVKGQPPRGRLAVALVGVALGAALWGIEGVVHGDALFHLGRVRKLGDLGSLSLRAVDEFKDGGLHPGYAFPLSHGWLALVTRLARVDPTSVMLHEPSVLVPIALLVAFETGVVVFRSVWLGLAALLAQVAIIGLAPGGGGAYAGLDLPGSMSRQVLVPAVIALFFEFVRGPSWQLALTLAAAGMDIAFVHPTYALFIAIPLVGFAVARALLARADVRESAGALASFAVPVVLVFAWLAPIVAETRSHNPGASELLRGLKQYATDLVVHSPHSYHLAPGVIARSGAVAVAALALVPLAGFATRRRWSALVLGGTLIVLVLELWVLVFPRFADLVSLSQARRAAGFVPFAFAFAGGAAVLARAAGLWLLPAALGAGIVCELQFPGDFGTKLHHGGPAVVVWIAFVGGAVALVAGAALAHRRLGSFEQTGLLAAAATLLFILPVAVHGFANWDAAVTSDANALSPGLVQYLGERVPQKSVVLADVETSYRISAYAPVYVVVAPPVHVADTKANRPYARVADVKPFLRTGSLATVRKYRPGWVVLRTDEVVPIRRLERNGLKPVYRDSRFVVFRL